MSSDAYNKGLMVSLTEEIRGSLAAGLNQSLASSIELGLAAKQAHWNLVDPNFIALHELFDEFYHEVTGFSDLLAERARILGFTAEGTLHNVAERFSGKGFKPISNDATGLVTALASRAQDFSVLLRENAGKAAEAGDPATEDLYIEIIRGVEKKLWFLRSHLNG